jgi:hypothetical protein
MFDAIRDWCKGRIWWWRAPFLIWFGAVLFRHLQDPLYNCILGPLNLGIHEFGHLIFSPLGEPWVVLGGTVAQVAAPVYGLFNFINQRDYFSSVLCCGWLSTNFFNIATYVADARTMALPLVTPFGGVDETTGHDWNYLLGAAGLLEADQFIAGIFRLLGLLAMLVCLSAGTWMLLLMPKKTAVIQTGKGL